MLRNLSHLFPKLLVKLILKVLLKFADKTMYKKIIIKHNKKEIF